MIVRAVVILCLVRLFVDNEALAEDPTDFMSDTNAEIAERNNMPKDFARSRTERGTCGVPATLTKAEKKESVDSHNHFRNLVKDNTNIIKLEWDDALAERAQELADKCYFAHGLTTDCEGRRVGQNMYAYTGPGMYFMPSINITKGVERWYKERGDYVYSSNSCKPGKVCGHYTQLVWASTLRVGCAYARCPVMRRVKPPSWRNTVLVVCDYSPGGNIPRQKPYMRGRKKCSKSHLSLQGQPDGVKCVGNLAERCNPIDDPKCKCKKDVSKSPRCINGVYDDKKYCKCVCDKGFTGYRCERTCACADEPKYAYACGSWAKKGYCTDPKYSTQIKRVCPLSCDVCPPPPPECRH